jgi:hypothetical protein
MRQIGSMTRQVVSRTNRRSVLPAPSSPLSCRFACSLQILPNHAKSRLITLNQPCFFMKTARPGRIARLPRGRREPLNGRMGNVRTTSSIFDVLAPALEGSSDIVRSAKRHRRPFGPGPHERFARTLASRTCLDRPTKTGLTGTGAWGSFRFRNRVGRGRSLPLTQTCA